jgi:hypothetical protein
LNVNKDTIYRILLIFNKNSYNQGKTLRVLTNHFHFRSLMMTHNKILSAAIVAALSMGGGAAQAAGTFALSQPVTTAPNVAYELFPTNPSALPDGTPFQVTYTLGLESNITKAFYINYTLTGGKWQTDPSSTSIELQDSAGTARAAPTVSFTAVSETTAQFLVLADGGVQVNKDDKLVLKGFQVKETGLATAGEKVDLGITLEDTTSGAEVDAAKTLTLVQSGVGTSVSFGTGDDTQVEIDVGQGGAKFTGGKYGTDAASLGTINIQYPNTRLKDYDLTLDWDFTDTNGVTGGTLDISNGPFKASKSANKVFIDMDGSNCTFTTGDLAGTVSSDTTAAWDLTKDQLTGLLGQGAKKICVTVASNNTTAINQTDEPPEAMLELKYAHNTTGLSYDGKLHHIEKNGIICSLYNVTDATKLDNSNIRVINRSTQDGTLTGSLRDQDNNAVFTNVNLGTIKPNQTKTWNSTAIAKIATDNGHSGEWGRGVLTIGSDLIKMEVFLLVRNTDPAGSKALLNQSQGASAGCN